MRAVIAEDTVLLREGLAGLLEDAGNEVVGRAGDAGGLLALVEEHAPDLAIVDVRMPPGWDGVETVERILQVTPRVELCICSAYSDYSWHEVIRRVGRPSLRLLRKPFATYELLTVTAELTEKWNRSNGALPVSIQPPPPPRRSR